MSLFENVQVTHHESGVKVIFAPIPSSTAVSVSAWVHVGAVDEQPHESGIAHYLEHMVFKGTQRYTGPTINRMIEENGGQQNAATSKDFTTYYCTLPADRWQVGLDMILDMVFAPKLDAKDFEDERHVILSEMRRDKDSPMSRLWKQFNRRVFARHPYRRETIGEEKIIRHVPLRVLRAFHRKHYKPSRVVLSIAGGVTSKDVMRQVHRLLKRYPLTTSRARRPRIPMRDRAAYKEDRLWVDHAEVNTCYAFLGWLAPHAGRHESYVADMALQYLLTRPGAFLDRWLRMEKNIVQHVEGSYWATRYAGLVEMVMQFDRARPETVRRAVVTGLKKALRAMTERDVEDCRENMIHGLHFLFEQSETLAHHLGYLDILGDLSMIYKYEAILNSVGVAEMKAFIQQYLLNAPSVMTVLAPKRS